MLDPQKTQSALIFRVTIGHPAAMPSILWLVIRPFWAEKSKPNSNRFDIGSGAFLSWRATGLSGRIQRFARPDSTADFNGNPSTYEP